MHLNDVWMVYFLQGKNFSLNSLSFHGIIKFCFLIDFDRKLLHGRLFVADVDHSVGTLADWFPNLVIVQGAGRHLLAHLRALRLIES